MNINSVIKNRRSIRKYKARKIPAKILRKILDAAKWAPSVHNLQPWKFIILEGKHKKKLVEALNLRRGKELLFIRLILKESIEIIENAPVAILVYNNGVFSNKIRKGGRFLFNNAHICEIQSVACAIQNMLLAAHSLGLGAAWLGISVFRKKQINKFFEGRDELMAILTIGYPYEKPAPPRRKPVSEIAIFRK